MVRVRKYRTPTYITWESLRYRCKYDGNDSYERYGGRGISFCEEWNSFSKFLQDMGERPEGHTLDRIDFEQDYNKDNCRWAPVETQQNNKSNNNKQEIDGKVLSISQWARELGIARSSIYSRMNFYGDTFHQAVDHLIKNKELP